ncbi:hypothetical protein BRUCa_3117 [Brucella melitensis]|uniref:Uncharacterized protein n=1 Tax=Brucella melitensis biotype 2 (strain ATCC 23457) TaxID=546272 RepID=C0RMC1_BRUMB|nr:Hypothetical protein, conserved [Brucella melitensis ATCC 23457]
MVATSSDGNLPVHNPKTAMVAGVFAIVGDGSLPLSAFYVRLRRYFP